MFRERLHQNRESVFDERQGILTFERNQLPFVDHLMGVQYKNFHPRLKFRKNVQTFPS